MNAFGEQRATEGSHCTGVEMHVMMAVTVSDREAAILHPANLGAKLCLHFVRRGVPTP
jgi:hypothetical protein